MSDAMVTGRMTQAKKKAGNKVLQKLGLNASQAINQLYDYLVDKGSLPFDNPTEAKRPFTQAQLEEARAYARSIPRKNAFSNMTDAEIVAHRLSQKHGIEVPSD